MENIKEKREENFIENTQKKVQLVGEGMTLFERVLAMSKNFSVWEIFKGLLMCTIIVMFGFVMLNPMFIVEKIDEIKDKEHANELTIRFEQTSLITSELLILMNKLHADRAFFIEYHNSVKSLEGAPFAFGSMDFEEVQDGFDYISDEYTDFSLTKYKFISYLNTNLLFVGSISEIEEIDKRLYMKLISSGVEQIALIEVQGVEHPLGILGVTWSQYDVVNTYRDGINKELRSGSMKLSYILNKN